MLEYILVNLLCIASLVLKLDFISYISVFVLIVLNLMVHKNKPEHLPINKRRTSDSSIDKTVDICLIHF